VRRSWGSAFHSSEAIFGWGYCYARGDYVIFMPAFVKLLLLKGLAPGFVTSPKRLFYSGRPPTLTFVTAINHICRQLRDQRAALRFTVPARSIPYVLAFA
jgi:hypothetical protein